MKKLFVGMAVMMSGCVVMVTQNFLTPEQAAKIPRKAEVIEVQSDRKPEDLYLALYKMIAAEGNRISAENKEMMTLSTEGKDIGQSVIVRMNLVVDKMGEGSRAMIRVDWKVGTEAKMMVWAATGASLDYDWMRATWAIEGRPQVAFAYAAMLARMAPGRVVYR